MARDVGPQSRETVTVHMTWDPGAETDGHIGNMSFDWTDALETCSSTGRTHWKRALRLDERTGDVSSDWIDSTSLSMYTFFEFLNTHV